MTFAASASNIKVSNAGLISQDINAKTWLIQFDLSWENSWHIAGSSSNRDAAWVFVKYRTNRGEWHTAFLNNTSHTITGASSPSMSIEPAYLNPSSAFNQSSNPALGVFIYRANSSLISGTNTISSVQLKWNYGSQSIAVADDASIDIRVFAIEMVFIPTANFAVGSGAVADNEFIITTVNTAIATTTPAGVGSLGGNAGGYPSGNTTPGSANFPNGYASFYSMKYEISQSQYADFLNTLTRAQQAMRFPSTTVGDYMYSAAGRTTPANRNGIKLIADAGQNIPRKYACDLNNNGIVNENEDGSDIACNYLSWHDAIAYLDWAGLRPLTEMEYEKMARGNETPILNQFTWGSTNIAGAIAISTNAGASSETVSSNLSNVIYAENGSTINGPLRVGIFSRATSNRENAGAGYYGNLD